MVITNGHVCQKMQCRFGPRIATIRQYDSVPFSLVVVSFFSSFFVSIPRSLSCPVYTGDRYAPPYADEDEDGDEDDDGDDDDDETVVVAPPLNCVQEARGKSEAWMRQAEYRVKMHRY
jgi:hypothetical protein